MERLTDADRGRLTRQASSAIIAARVGKAREQASKEAAKRRRTRRKARAEFSAWKRQICAMVQGESKIVSDDEGDGFTFVVPKRLVRFIFALMVKEYMATKGAKDVGEARDMIQADVAKHAETVEARQQGEGQGNGAL